MRSRPPHRHRQHPHRQRGVSLIELMLGVTISLFIIATAGVLFVGQLREYRAIVLETRLTQDLRTALDMVSRDLRRAGYWGHAGRAGANPYAGIDANAGTIALRYSTDAVENDVVDTNEQFGFRLRTGAIELQLGAGNWQSLTDPAQLTVTAFSVTPALQDIDLVTFCPTPCVAEGGCAPHQQRRSFDVEITARLVSAPSVSRSVRSTANVRGDVVTGSCAT